MDIGDSERAIDDLDSKDRNNDSKEEKKRLKDQELVRLSMSVKIGNICI